MSSSWKRHLQRAAAARFDEATGVFWLAELRLEAAFRSWLGLVEIKGAPPASLPSASVLNDLADTWDAEYGPYVWWPWPVWSTCSVCSKLGEVSCSDCRSFSAYIVEAPLQDTAQ